MPRSAVTGLDAPGAQRHQQRNRLRARGSRSKPEIALALRKTRPADLRVQATYLTNGLGGTELIRTGGFPGTVVGQDFTAFGDVLRQLFSANYPTWTVGFTVSYPLGRSADQSALVRSGLEREQSVAQLRSSELKVVREVRQAAMQLEQNRERIETTRVGRELSEQRLDAEQKRFEVGMSTNFNVIQAQRDLAVARNNELQAQLDYQLALIAYETVQRVGGTSIPGAGGSTSTISIPSSGATTTPSTTGTTVLPVGPGGGPGGN